MIVINRSKRLFTTSLIGSRIWHNSCCVVGGLFMIWRIRIKGRIYWTLSSFLSSILINTSTLEQQHHANNTMTKRVSFYSNPIVNPIYIKWQKTWNTLQWQFHPFHRFEQVYDTLTNKVHYKQPMLPPSISSISQWYQTRFAWESLRFLKRSTNPHMICWRKWVNWRMNNSISGVNGRVLYINTHSQSLPPISSKISHIHILLNWR